MLKLIFSTIVLLSIIFIGTSKATEPEKEQNVYCYYDSCSYFRGEIGKIKITNMEPALKYCTHLIYGYATISSINYKLIPLNANLDMPGHLDYYNTATKLKKKFPHLKVYLSVGGGSDLDKPEKYLTLLESSEARKNFIESVTKTLEEYGFDGIDLAWQFPADKPKKSHSTLGSVWHGIKSVFSKKPSIDEKYEEHRDQFGKLLKELYSEIGVKDVVVSVLPNVNTMFFDHLALKLHTEKIILHAYDFYTPYRYENVGDHASPIKALDGRLPEMNIEAIVTNWIKTDIIPSNKLILAVPTYGRSWKTASDCDPSGVPPIKTNGPGPEGPHTGKRGLLAYCEICNNIIEDEKTNIKFLSRMSDETRKCGSYAYDMKYKNNDFGVWISYEDPADIGNKVEFLKEKNLSGIAIMDLTLDDYEGVCTGVQFPLLKAAVVNLKAVNN